MSSIDNILTREYGISPELCALAEETERQVRGEFERIDRVRDYNQLKVLRSMQKNGLAERHFNFSTGYGYADIGRDLLDRIFADAFGCEDALVRSQFISGTHALTVALFGILRPGDTVVSVTGKPYDTLEGILGIRGDADEGSLKDFGVNYRQVDLLPDGSPDLSGIAAAVPGVKLAIMQRSRGYSSRDALSVDTLGRIVRAVKEASPSTLVMCDNCYGEFVDVIEPVNVGADYMVGSLIKNPGGGLALTGGYIAGRAECVRKCANRLTAPGLGKHVGSSLGTTRNMVQGFYIAPHTVAESLKGAVFTAALFEKLGYDTSPAYDAPRSDIVQTVRFRSPEKLAEFCRMIQLAAPVDSDAVPVADDMPGYEAQVIMAAGNFVQGASIELSADGPMIPPYTAFMQGGLTYVNVKLAALMAAEALSKFD
ncbi:MAG: methionine gamma-lyase family protein [Clostridia bacterium]|nr:methionine gamma-lyase family protein [Clostridia bacterium]